MVACVLCCFSLVREHRDLLFFYLFYLFISLFVYGRVAPPQTEGCPFRSVTAAVGGTWNTYALDESGAKSREKSVGRFVPRGAESSFLPAVEGKYHEVCMEKFF